MNTQSNAKRLAAMYQAAEAAFAADGGCTHCNGATKVDLGDTRFERFDSDTMACSHCTDASREVGPLFAHPLYQEAWCFEIAFKKVVPGRWVRSTTTRGKNKGVEGALHSFKTYEGGHGWGGSTKALVKTAQGEWKTLAIDAIEVVTEKQADGAFAVLKPEDLLHMAFDATENACFKGREKELVQTIASGCRTSETARKLLSQLDSYSCALHAWTDELTETLLVRVDELAQAEPPVCRWLKVGETFFVVGEAVRVGKCLVQARNGSTRWVDVVAINERGYGILAKRARMSISVSLVVLLLMFCVLFFGREEP